MPGRSASGDRWGQLPLVVDTSAWARAQAPSVLEDWVGALLEGRMCLSPVSRMEILLSARGSSDFDTLAEQIDIVRPAPLSIGVIGAAEAAMRALAQRSAGAQRLPIVDYLVAAAAQELGAAVIHYDHDYDRLAEVLEFESVWLVPPGTLK